MYVFDHLPPHLAWKWSFSEISLLPSPPLRFWSKATVLNAPDATSTFGNASVCHWLSLANLYSIERARTVVALLFLMARSTFLQVSACAGATIAAKVVTARRRDAILIVLLMFVVLIGWRLRKPDIATRMPAVRRGESQTCRLQVRRGCRISAPGVCDWPRPAETQNATCGRAGGAWLPWARVQRRRGR